MLFNEKDFIDFVNGAALFTRAPRVNWFERASILLDDIDKAVERGYRPSPNSQEAIDFIRLLVDKIQPVFERDCKIIECVWREAQGYE